MNEGYQTLKREGSRKNEIDFPTLHFTNSVKEVIHTMTGMEAIEVNVQKENNDEFVSQVTGVMLLTGERNMMMSLSMSKNLAAALVAFMTSNQPADLREEDICDGIEELVHMISGITKARLRSFNYNFTSLLPFAVVGDRHKLHFKNNVIEILKRYTVAENDIILTVHFI